MSDLTGTLRLARLAVRRDRITLPAWILALSGFVAATAAMFMDSLAVQAELVRETELVATSAGMRMIGLTSGPSIGGYLLHREFVTLVALVALMSAFTVVRHTRQNEELGRAEMLGATVVGRYAPLAAATIVAAVADVVLALALTLAMVVAGLPLAGSLLAGTSVAVTGLAFAGIAAVGCQLTSTTRGASGLTVAALGVSFLLSGVGNMTGSVDAAGTTVTSAWPAWLSPMGWGQQTRPFGEARWWPLGLSLLLFAATVATAFVLVRRRDLGRGLWPERLGRAHARATLLSPIGLTWRLERGVFFGWLTALLLFAVIFGTLTEQIQDLKGDAAEWYAELGGSEVILDAFQASIIQMVGMFVAIYVVQVLLRLRADESGGTLEPVLATGVSRWGWLLGHVVNAVVGATLIMVGFAVAMGLGTAAVLGDPAGQVGMLTTAALVQLPGVLVLGSLVVVLVGVLPRWATPLSWIALIASLVIGPMFGPSLRLPGWVLDLSPFTHLPKAPATDIAVGPVVVLTLVCVALGVLGALAVRRRDLVLPA